MEMVLILFNLREKLCSCLGHLVKGWVRTKCDVTEQAPLPGHLAFYPGGPPFWDEHPLELFWPLKHSLLKVLYIKPQCQPWIPVWKLVPHAKARLSLYYTNTLFSLCKESVSRLIQW